MKYGLHWGPNRFWVTPRFLSLGFIPSFHKSLSLLYGSAPAPFTTTKDGHLSFVWESTLRKNLHFEYPYYIGLINVKWYAM